MYKATIKSSSFLGDVPAYIYYIQAKLYRIWGCYMFELVVHILSYPCPYCWTQPWPLKPVKKFWWIKRWWWWWMHDMHLWKEQRDVLAEVKYLLTHYFIWDLLRYQATQWTKGVMQPWGPSSLASRESWKGTGLPHLDFTHQPTGREGRKGKSRGDTRSKHIQSPDCKVITI